MRAMMQVLHVGSGRKSDYDAGRLFASVGLRMRPITDVRVTHLDADPRVEPDLVCRLGEDGIPLADDSVDLIIAWHVLEHVGRQGDTREWFFAWEELYRVLKPGGFLYGESPYYDSLWAWLDPSHTRVIGEGSFTFFRQDSYRDQGNMISPFRIACDFEGERLLLSDMLNPFVVLCDPGDPRRRNLRFSLRAVKPLRPWWAQ